MVKLDETGSPFRLLAMCMSNMEEDSPCGSTNSNINYRISPIKCIALLLLAWSTPRL